MNYEALDAKLKKFNPGFSAVPGGSPHHGTTAYTANVVYTQLRPSGFEGNVVAVINERNRVAVVDNSRLSGDLAAGLRMSLPGYSMEEYSGDTALV